jgi:hypothetical protein
MLMPGVIENLPIETHFEPLGFTSKIAALLVTGEFYFGPSSRTSGPDFILERPLDEADRKSGGYCSATGYWTAGHDLVYVGGRPYARKYAPAHAHEEVDGKYR